MKKLFSILVLFVSSILLVLVIGCDNDVANNGTPTTSPVIIPGTTTTQPQSIIPSINLVGNWIDPTTNLKYEINSSGYKVTQNGNFIERGTYIVNNSNRNPNIYKSYLSRRASSSVKGFSQISLNPEEKNGYAPITKQEISVEYMVDDSTYIEPAVTFNNTVLQKEAVTLPNEIKDISIYVESSKSNSGRGVPYIHYIRNSFDNENLSNANSLKASMDYYKSISSDRAWYKYTVKSVSNVNFAIKNKANNNTFVNARVVTDDIWLDFNGNITSPQPSRVAGTRDSYLYLRGSFSWIIQDGFNNLKEIEDNVFQGRLYLTKDIHGFKVGTDDWEIDYSVPLNYKGFVPKGEWFDIVESYYSEWFSKNAALSTGNGYYTFTLDLNNMKMLITSDEVSNLAYPEEKKLYVIGDFTGDPEHWYFKDENEMGEISPGVWKTIKPIRLDTSTGFKISDRTWGAILNDYGTPWWYPPPNLVIGIPAEIYGAYDEDIKGSTVDILLDVSGDLSYHFTLNTNNRTVLVEEAKNTTTTTTIPGATTTTIPSVTTTTIPGATTTTIPGATTTTIPDGTETLSAPTFVRIYETLANSIRVRWNSVNTASKYEIWYSTIQNGSYTKAGEQAAAKGVDGPSDPTIEDIANGGSYKIDHLSENTKYYVKVKAFDILGNYSPFSEITSTTTLSSTEKIILTKIVIKNLGVDFFNQYFIIAGIGLPGGYDIIGPWDYNSAIIKGQVSAGGEFSFTFTPNYEALSDFSFTGATVPNNTTGPTSWEYRIPEGTTISNPKDGGRYYILGDASSWTWTLVSDP